MPVGCECSENATALSRALRWPAYRAALSCTGGERDTAPLHLASRRPPAPVGPSSDDIAMFPNQLVARDQCGAAYHGIVAGDCLLDVPVDVGEHASVDNLAERTDRVCRSSSLSLFMS